MKGLTTEVRFWMKVNKTEYCWLWLARKDKDGYGRFYWNKKQRGAHRIAYMLSTGNYPPDDLVVCYKCDNPSCVNPEHLFLGTVSDNIKDKVSKKRTACGNNNGKNTHPESRSFGIKNPNAKFTDEMIRQIREMYKKIKSHRKIAQHFGVVKSTISSILNGKTWTHIK